MKSFLEYIDRNKVSVTAMGIFVITIVIGLGLRGYLAGINDNNRVVPVSLVVSVGEKHLQEKQALLELKQRKFELCIYGYRASQIKISEAEKCKVHLN